MLHESKGVGGHVIDTPTDIYGLPMVLWLSHLCSTLDDRSKRIERELMNECGSKLIWLLDSGAVSLMIVIRQTRLVSVHQEIVHQGKGLNSLDWLITCAPYSNHAQPLWFEFKGSLCMSSTAPVWYRLHGPHTDYYRYLLYKTTHAQQWELSWRWSATCKPITKPYLSCYCSLFFSSLSILLGIFSHQLSEPRSIVHPSIQSVSLPWSTWSLLN